MLFVLFISFCCTYLIQIMALPSHCLYMHSWLLSHSSLRYPSKFGLFSLLLLRNFLILMFHSLFQTIEILFSKRILLNVEVCYLHLPILNFPLIIFMLVSKSFFFLIGDWNACLICCHHHHRNWLNWLVARFWWQKHFWFNMVLEIWITSLGPKKWQVIAY